MRVALERLVVIVGLAFIVIAVWDQSVNGRQELVNAERAMCIRASYVSTLFANILRADQQSNAVLAHDPAVSRSTRETRRREAAVENTLLLRIDRNLDRTALPYLNPIGSAYIRSLGDRAFSCRDAYRDATPFQFGAISKP